MNEGIARVGRRCTGCGQRKSPAEFYSNVAAGKRCRQCVRAYHLERIRRRAAFIGKYKTDRGCMDCGFQSEHPEVFDLDHRPGEEKVAHLSRFRSNGTIEAMIAEMAKCDVVCANCHRIRTKLRGDSGRNADWDLRRAAETAEAMDLSTVADAQLALDIA